MQQDEQKSKNSKVIVVIILVVVAILLILGIVGYLVYRYYLSKSIKPISAPTPISTSSSLNISQKMSQMFDTLDYPNSTITSKGEIIDEDQIIERNMQTSDSVTKTYDYYMGLAEKNKWGLGSLGMSTDKKQAFLTLTGDGFKTDFNMDLNTDKNRTIIELDLQIGNDLKNNGDFDYEYYDNNDSTSDDSEKKQVSTDYIISDSDTRVISESELVDFTPWELKVARNEIYARHGRPFVHEDLQCYFAKKSWYSEDSNFSESVLSIIEVKNISIILDYEKEINSPLLGKDSGC